MCAPLGTLRAAVHADVRAHVFAAVLLPLLRLVLLLLSLLGLH